jgi:RNA polymerase sigma-70 factor (ECF subfamily)
MDKQRQPEEQHETPAEGANQRAIFDAYHGRVERFFESRGFQEADALDLTQETFIRVFQNMDNLRSQSSLGPWILRIAANLWKNEIRFQKAGKRDAQEVSFEGAGTEGDAIERAALEMKQVPSQLDEALASERLGAVEKCLDTLPPRMRRCFVLHIYQDRKYQEIADVLEVSIQSVKSHIHQARQRLAECVARRLAGGAA